MSKFAMILVVATALCHAQWYAQSSGTNYTLKSIHFIDENTGFIAGYYTILKTTNAGEQWDVTYMPGGHNFIVFVSSGIGFIFGENGKIFKTTNSSASWNEVTSSTNNHLIKADFLNAQTGIAVGYNRTILKTTNSGVSWENLITNNDTLNFLGCRILSESKYIVTGTSSTIYTSSNSGASWNASTLGMVNPLWAPEFINENTGWVTGCCGIFIKTTDAGQTWSPENYLTLGNTVYTLKFINNTTGYLCGDGGNLFRTTNAGSSWDSTITGTDQILYSLYMVDSNIGWAVGNYGTILKTTNGGGPGFTIGIENISSEIPSAFDLYQNYPNPFNPVTTIKFDIAKASYVRLRIFDALGRELLTPVSQFLTAGKYSVDVNMVNSSSGVYFYKLETENFLKTLKFVLTK